MLYVFVFVHIHFVYVYTCQLGEGNDNPLQYSCLQNPVDGGAWWAAVHRVAQSRTQLKRLSSSSSSRSSESLELRGKALQTDS